MVRCLVNRDDIVSRLSLSNAKSLAKEILARRPHWEPLLSSDLDGVYERAKTLWAPNQRQSFDAINGGDGNDETKKEHRAGIETSRGGVSADAIVLEATQVTGAAAAAAAASDKDFATKGGDNGYAFKNNSSTASDDDKVKTSELRQATPDLLKLNTERARLVVPGAICHVYNWRGQSRCALVDHRFGSLRRIEAFQTCIRDHLRKNMNSSLREVFTARKLEARGMPLPPQWEKMSAIPGQDVCCCVCGFHVTWALTGKASTETARATHHCRACGRIVCKDCSRTKMSLPQYAILSAERVCDVCANRGCLESFEDLGPMPPMWNGKIPNGKALDGERFFVQDDYEDDDEEEGSDMDDDEMWEDAR